MSSQENTQNDLIQKSPEIYAFPASYGQQQLWFLNQLDPESAVYNIPFAFRLNGILNISALEKSINEIIKRHETFRTVFEFKDDSLKQIIISYLNLSLEIFDYSSKPEKEFYADKKLHEFTLRPFNLEKGPLIRAGLIILDSSEYILLLSFHHTILDHTAVVAFFQELTRNYNSFAEGLELSLTQPEIQYADVVMWQRQDDQAADLARKLEYWKNHLKDQESLLELPADKPRPAKQSFKGKELSVSFPGLLSNKIRDLSRKEKKSLFMVLLTGFKILLSRYSDRTDITVGCPFANRNQPGLEDVMGCCMNTLPLRTIFSPEDTFLEILDKVRDVTLAAQANQEVSFEQIVEELKPVRDAAFNPLFQVSFMFQEPVTTIKLNGLECRSAEIKSNTSRFDLTFWLWDSPEGFQGTIQFNTDLFEDGTIQRMVRNFSTLFESITSFPETKVCDYEIISPDEKNTLLTEWNNTAADYPENNSINQLFEAAAEKFPRHIAVEFEDEKISYKELNKRANQLAYYLRSAGAESGSFIGIMLDRSIDAVVALLASLKTGGAYIPLDPAFPLERLEYMIRDSGINILVTQQKYSGRFSSFRGTEVLLDTERKIISKQKNSNLSFEISSNALAYVIYTSGSTGRPKGVQIEHRSLVNFLFSMKREPGLKQTDSLLSVTTLSFDIAALEIFLPIITGAKLIIVSRDTTLDGKSLLEKLESGKVKVMQATPTTFRLMIASGWEKKLNVKILCGGEPLPSDLAEKLLELSNELWNMYGPTETTVWSTIKKINSPDSITIGRPIANTSIYIIDNNNKLVPIGAKGELCIGGDGLARGYLNNPELTEKSFLANPFKDKDRGKIYKTGDLARYRSDGEIECLGRLDHQVKVRGFRIEPGEVESVISEHEFVKENVVVANEDEQGNARLAAYITVNENIPQSSYEITNEKLYDWQLIWDDAYKAENVLTDPTFDISGWKSSYTGNQIPAYEMQEWIDNTVNAILELNPENILEIGCGTGLLLFRLAPKCKHYLGIDFSVQVLNRTEQIVEEKNLTNVELQFKEAHQIDDVKNNFFDTIIINSVIQYFPGQDYLVKVIEKAMRLLKPGGRIYIGDVRNFQLLSAFSISVELERNKNITEVSELLSLTNKRISEEEELLVDPQFFPFIQKKINRISNIEMHIKRGSYLNEMTRYRYDVILHTGGSGEEVEIRDWIDYAKQNLKISDIESELIKNEKQVFAVRNIPNCRIIKDVRLFNILSESRNKIPLKQALSEVEAPGTEIDPELLHKLGEKYGRKVISTWSISGTPGYFDVIFIRNDFNRQFKLFSSISLDNKNVAFTNNPLLPKFKRALIPSLRKLLTGRLPDYMIPSVFVVLDKLPLTSNGKIDRKSLPSPDFSRVSSPEKYSPPQNKVEQQLIEIWQQLLRVKNISTKDNFFELGGHSILVIQLFRQIEQQIKVELSIASIFECPTISQLAAKIVEAAGHN